MLPPERIEYDQWVARAREVLGDAEFDEAWRRGAALTTDDAVALAVSARRSGPITPPCDHYEPDAARRPTARRLLRVPRDRRHVGAPAPVPRLRPDELLQPEPQPACQRTLRGDGASDDPVGGAGRGVAVVLRRRSPLPPRSRRTGRPNPVIDDLAPGPHGPLANVLAVRSGTGGLEHREALIYTLGKAAELEHLVMLQYLFAAFSLKQAESEGVSAEQLAAIGRWRRTLLEISGQEMLHLALVQNLLTAVGAAPRLARPELPDAGLQLSGRRPHRAAPVRRGGPAPLRVPRAARGHGRRGRRGVRGHRAGRRAPPRPVGRDRPAAPGVRDDRRALPLDPAPASSTSRDGSAPERLFIGPANAQATEEHFRWTELVAVTDVASARLAHRHDRRAGRGCPGRMA